VSGSSDNTIRIWGLESGLLKQILDEHTQDITCLQYRPNSDDLLMTGANDKVFLFLGELTIKLLKLWSMETGDCISTFEEHTKSIRCLQFLPGILHFKFIFILLRAAFIN
jgi:WD40 repeat protein